MSSNFPATQSDIRRLAIYQELIGKDHVTRVTDAGCDSFLKMTWEAKLAYEAELPLKDVPKQKTCFELSVDVSLVHKASSCATPVINKIATVTAAWLKGVPADDFSKTVLGLDISAVATECHYQQSLDPWLAIAPDTAHEMSRNLAGYLLRLIFSGAMAHNELRNIQTFETLVRILVSFVGKGIDGRAGLPANNSQYRNAFVDGVGIYSIAIPRDPLKEIEVVWGNSRRALLEAEDHSIPIRTSFKQKLSSIAGLYNFDLTDAPSGYDELKKDFAVRDVIFQSIKKVNQVLKE